MKLYSGPLGMFGAKAEIAAREKGLGLEVVMVPFDMDRLYRPEHPEVARINPKGQVPVLVDGGLEIFDSTQIFEYLETVRPTSPLRPADPRARAAAAAFHDDLERRLGDGRWLVETFSHADIAFFMAQLFGERMGVPLSVAHPRLRAWRDRVGARPAVDAVAGAMARYLVSVGRPLPPFLAATRAGSPIRGSSRTRSAVATAASTTPIAVESNGRRRHCHRRSIHGSAARPTGSDCSFGEPGSGKALPATCCAAQTFPVTPRRRQ